MSATVLSNTVLIDEEVQASACNLVRAVGDEHVTAVSLHVGGRSVIVPRDLARLMTKLVEQAAEGGVFTVQTMPEELTTTVAAEMLGISRPTLMKLIAAGEIEGRRVRSHTRLASKDVMAFARRRTATRQVAFEELRALSDELDED